MSYVVYDSKELGFGEILSEEDFVAYGNTFEIIRVVGVQELVEVAELAGVGCCI